MSHCFYLIYHIFKSKAIYHTLCHSIYVPDKSLPGDLVLTQLSACRVNSFLASIGVVEKGSEIYFLGSLKWWTPAFFVINVWKDTGWQTIIIMATLVGISQEIYDKS